MNEQYKRLVNAVFPDEDLTALAKKTNVDKKDVEHITIEIIVRIFGDGSDLSKETIEHKIKQIVGSAELKGLISRLEFKYGISSGTASKVLGEMLPNLFRKVVTLDNSYFESKEVEKHEVQYKALEEAKPIEELKQEIVKPVEIKKEETVDDVFKNIENNVIKEEKSKYNIEADKKLKKKKSLFAKKDKKEKAKVEEIKEDKREFSIIEKICIIVVLVALAALIGTIVFLVIKQNMSM